MGEYLSIKSYIKKNNISYFGYDKYGLYYCPYPASQLNRLLSQLNMEETLSSITGEENLQFVNKIINLKMSVFVDDFKPYIQEIRIDDTTLSNNTMKIVIILDDKYNKYYPKYIDVMYDFINGRVLPNNNFTVQVADVLNVKLFNEKKELNKFLGGYFQAAIHTAIDKEQLSIYLTGWENEFYKIPFWGSNNRTKEDMIEFLEFTFSAPATFMMFIYCIYAISHERIHVHELYNESIVMNVYGNDKKKRNTYANLYLNLIGIENKPNII